MPRNLRTGLLFGAAVTLVGEVQAALGPACVDRSLRSIDELIMRTQGNDTESRLREVIGQLQRAEPDYGQMEPALRVALRQQLDMTASMLRALGALQSITYEGRQQNADVYDVRFANGEAVWLIALSAEGKIATLFVNRPVFTQTATEDRLRDVIGHLQQGQPDYDQMEPALQVAVRSQIEAAAAKLRALGAIQAITYKGRQQGAEAYEVRFANGETVWLIALSPEGRIATLSFK